MAFSKMGSFSASVQSNSEIIDLIYTDIEIKTGNKLSKTPLRHVTIYDDDGNLYAIDGFNYEIKDGAFSTPLNEKADMIEIKSIKALQPCSPEIYYLR